MPKTDLGTQLWTLLRLLRKNPDQFVKTNLCRLQTVKKYCPEFYQPELAHDEHSLENATLALSGLLASICIDARDDNGLAIGALLLYQTIFGEISTGRSIPAFEAVLTTTSSSLEKVQSFLENLDACQPQGKNAHRQWLTDVTGGQNFTGMTQSIIQTDRNYMTAAINELAARIYRSGAGDVFADQVVEPAVGKPVVVIDQSLLNSIRDISLARCCDLPLSFGITLAIAECVEQSCSVRKISGSLDAADYSGNCFPITSGLLICYPMCGATTWMKQTGYKVLNKDTDGSQVFQLAFYVDSTDYLKFVTRVDVFRYIVERDAGREFSLAQQNELYDALTDLDDAGRILILMDRFGELGVDERDLLMRHLRITRNVVYSVYPWQVEAVLKQFQLNLKPSDNLVTFQLNGLSQNAQFDFISNLSASRHPVNLDLGRWILHDLPGLSRWPFGVLAVFQRLVANRSGNTAILKHALGEWFVRAGFKEPAWVQQGVLNDPAVGPIVRAMRNASFASLGNVTDGLEESAGVWIEMDKSLRGKGWETVSRSELFRSRLFELRSSSDGQEMGRIFDPDFEAFFLAYAAYKTNWSGYRYEISDGRSNEGQFLSRVNQFIDGLWEDARNP